MLRLTSCLAAGANAGARRRPLTHGRGGRHSNSADDALFATLGAAVVLTLWYPCSPCNPCNPCSPCYPAPPPLGTLGDKGEFVEGPLSRCHSNARRHVPVRWHRICCVRDAQKYGRGAPQTTERFNGCGQEKFGSGPAPAQYDGSSFGRRRRRSMRAGAVLIWVGFGGGLGEDRGCDDREMSCAWSLLVTLGHSHSLAARSSESGGALALAGDFSRCGCALYLWRRGGRLA